MNIRTFADENVQKWHLQTATGGMVRYSTSELLIGLAEGKVLVTDLVWCEGMGNWTKIEALDSEALKNAELSFVDASMLSRANFVKSPAQRPTTVRLGPSQSKIPRFHKIQKFYVPVAVAVGLGILCVGVFFVFGKSYKLPPLEDVFAQERANLEQALSSGPEVSNTAISKTKSTTPTFYVASPSEDGKQVEVILYGIDGKLIGRPRLMLRQKVKIKDGFATTQPFDYLGNAVPTGEYMVFSKPISVKSLASSDENSIYKMTAQLKNDVGYLTKNGYSQNLYFLGGIRDQEYYSTLKQYHEHQRQENSFERSELRNLFKKQKELFEVILRISSFGPSRQVDAKRLHQESLATIKKLSLDIASAQTTWQPSVILNEYLNVELYRNSSLINQILLTWLRALDGANAQGGDFTELKNLFAQDRTTISALMKDLEPSQ